MHSLVLNFILNFIPYVLFAQKIIYEQYLVCKSRNPNWSFIKFSKVFIFGVLGLAINESETQKPIVRKDMLELSTSKVEGQSAYSHDFPKYPNATPSRQCSRANNLHRLPGKVEAETSYTHHFSQPIKDVGLSKSELIVRPDNLHPTKDKFNQQSVTSADFQ